MAERKASTARSDLERMLVDEAAEPKALPLSLLEDITGDFSDGQEIGRGGFAVVYKIPKRGRDDICGLWCIGLWSARYCPPASPRPVARSPATKSTRESTRTSSRASCVCYHRLLVFYHFGWGGDGPGSSPRSSATVLGDRAVAVKRLCDSLMDEREFHREVECLMRVKHTNVVRFLGYCANREGTMEMYDKKLVMADVHQRLLCFEYIPQGSLDKYITDPYREWGTCYKIIRGICEGLQYLHENNIVHLDLKPANILLGNTMVPKITDFGLSRCFDENQSRHITRTILGTIGYLAPELREGGVISRSADLYSLGVIIIEILTSQKGYQAIGDVLESWSDRLEGSQQDTQTEQIRVCYETALECRDFNPKKRPASVRNIIDRCYEKGSIQDQETRDPSGFRYIGGDPAPRGPAGQGVSTIVSRDQFERLLPHRNDAVCPARGFYTYDAFITAADAFPSFGMTGSTETRKQEVAAFFAQTSHETSAVWPTAPDDPFSCGYWFKEEIGPWPNYCVPSTKWPCTPGKQYYGRGPMQLSYNFNYGPAGLAIGVDLLNNPDLVATDPVVSFKTALWFWMTAQGNKPSCHAVMTGQWTPTVADIAAGRLPGFGVVTNIINAQEVGKGKDARVTNRIGFYKRYCDILDVGNLDCYNQRPFGQ